MTRLPMIALAAFALSGCADQSAPMWTGPDISRPLSGPPAVAAQPTSSSIPSEPTTQQTLNRRVGSGTPPDLLRAPAEGVRPPTLAPLTSAPPSPGPGPSPMDGTTLQRTGPIGYGSGAVYNSVGSTIFGPGGKVCTPVGSSLTCL